MTNTKLVLECNKKKHFFFENGILQKKKITKRFDKKTNVTEPWTGFLLLCFVFSHVKRRRKNVFFFLWTCYIHILGHLKVSTPFLLDFPFFASWKSNYFLLKIKMFVFAEHKASTVCMKINYKNGNPSTQENIFCPLWSKYFETKSNLVLQNFQDKTCLRMLKQKHFFFENRILHEKKLRKVFLQKQTWVMNRIFDPLFCLFTCQKS